MGGALAASFSALLLSRGLQGYLSGTAGVEDVINPAGSVWAQFSVLFAPVLAYLQPVLGALALAGSIGTVALFAKAELQVGDIDLKGAILLGGWGVIRH